MSAPGMGRNNVSEASGWVMRGATDREESGGEESGILKIRAVSRAVLRSPARLDSSRVLWLAALAGGDKWGIHIYRIICRLGYGGIP